MLKEEGEVGASVLHLTTLKAGHSLTPKSPYYFWAPGASNSKTTKRNSPDSRDSARLWLLLESTMSKPQGHYESG